MTSYEELLNQVASLKAENSQLRKLRKNSSNDELEHDTETSENSQNGVPQENGDCLSHAQGSTNLTGSGGSQASGGSGGSPECGLPNQEQGIVNSDDRDSNEAEGPAEKLDPDAEQDESEQDQTPSPPPENRNTMRDMDESPSKRRPGDRHVYTKVRDLEQERSSLLHDLESEDRMRKWFVDQLDLLTHKMDAISVQPATPQTGLTRHQLEFETKKLRETLHETLGTSEQMAQRHEARLRRIHTIDIEMVHLQQQQHLERRGSQQLGGMYNGQKSRSDASTNTQASGEAFVMKSGPGNNAYTSDRLASITPLGVPTITIATQTADVEINPEVTRTQPQNEGEVLRLFHGAWPSCSNANVPVNHEELLTSPGQQDSMSLMSFDSNNSGSSSFQSHSKKRSPSKPLGTKVEMVYSLLSMLGTHDKDDMSRTLLAMSRSQDSCIAMRQSGCMPLLVQLLHGCDKDSGLLGNIRGSKAARARAAAALHNIVHSHPDDKRGRREARVLRLLEQVRGHCDQIIEPGDGEDPNAMDNSLREMDHHPGPAIAALMKLSFDEEHRHAICTLGGLQAIAELLKVDQDQSGTTNDQHCVTLRRYACMALTNLTFGDGTNKALLCSMGLSMEALVAQLYSANEDLCQVAASVLRNLSWRADLASKKTLREISAVVTLMRAAMTVKKESSLKSVLSALWNLSAHCSENKVDICSVDGALAFLVVTLSYKSPTNTLAIVENGGGILRNVSSHIAVREDYRSVLRINGCLQVLLRHLRSPSLTIVSNACGTLWNLSARCPEDQQALWDMGAVSMLRNLVHSKHKMISMGSSAALKNLLASRPVNAASETFGKGKAAAPSLHVRKQRALEAELDENLTETCDNVESPRDSPIDTQRDENKRFVYDNDAVYQVSNDEQRRFLLRNNICLPNGDVNAHLRSPKKVARSGSQDSVGSVHSDISHDRARMAAMGKRTKNERQSTSLDRRKDAERHISRIEQAKTPAQAIKSEDEEHHTNTKDIKNHATQFVPLRSKPGSHPMLYGGNINTGQYPDPLGRTPYPNTPSLCMYRPDGVRLTYSNLGANPTRLPAAQFIVTPRLNNYMDNTSNQMFTKPTENYNMESNQMFSKQTENYNIESNQMFSKQTENYHIESNQIFSKSPENPKDDFDDTSYAETDLDCDEQPTDYSLRYAEMVETNENYERFNERNRQNQNKNVVFNTQSNQTTTDPSDVFPNQNKSFQDKNHAYNRTEQFAKNPQYPQTSQFSQNHQQFAHENPQFSNSNPLQFNKQYDDSQQYDTNSDDSDYKVSDEPHRYDDLIPDTLPSVNDDTLLTFYTEGTPLYYMSKANSLTDLTQKTDDKKPQNINPNDQIPSHVDQAKSAISNSTDVTNNDIDSSGLTLSNVTVKENDHRSADDHSPDKLKTYAEEGTPVTFSRVSSLSSLTGGEMHDGNHTLQAIDEIDVTLRAESFAEPPATPPLEYKRLKPGLKQEGSTEKEHKTVKFDENMLVEETPLMFSRSSSIGSLSSFDAQSVHSSVVSEYSRRASEVVSPSELPDSPSETMPPSPKRSKSPSDLAEIAAATPSTIIKKPHAMYPVIKQTEEHKSGLDILPPDDAPIIYATEGTPLSYSEAGSGSLSVMTFDDYDIEAKDLGCEKMKESPPIDDRDNDNDSSTSEVSEGEEDILAQCISAAMPASSGRKLRKSTSDNQLKSKTSLVLPRMEPAKTDNTVNVTKSPPKSRLVQPKSVVSKLPPQSNQIRSILPFSQTKSPPNRKIAVTTPIVRVIPVETEPDTMVSYATEGTPVNFSRSTSLSNLSNLSFATDIGLPSNDLSNDLSNLESKSSDNSLLGDDHDELLSEIIMAAMPKKRQLSSSTHSKPKPTSRKSDKPSINLSNVQPISPFIPTRTSSIAEAIQPGDQAKVYAVEGSPANFSSATSLSDLTVNSGEAASCLKPRELSSLSTPSKKSTRFSSKSGADSVFHYTADSEDSPLKFKMEGTPQSFSRNDSLSSLSCEEDELALADDKNPADDSLNEVFSTSSVTIKPSSETNSIKSGQTSSIGSRGEVVGQSSESLSPSGDATRDDFVTKYAVEGTPTCFSRNSSLSSLNEPEPEIDENGNSNIPLDDYNSRHHSAAADFVSNEPTDCELALLNECISSVMPVKSAKSQNRTRSLPRNSHNKVTKKPDENIQKNLDKNVFKVPSLPVRKRSVNKKDPPQKILPKNQAPQQKKPEKTTEDHAIVFQQSLHQPIFTLPSLVSAMGGISITDEHNDTLVGEEGFDEDMHDEVEDHFRDECDAAIDGILNEEFNHLQITETGDKSQQNHLAVERTHTFGESITSEDERVLAENVNIVLSALNAQQISIISEDMLLENETLSLVSNDYASDSEDPTISSDLPLDASKKPGPRITKPLEEVAVVPPTPTEAVIRGHRKPLYPGPKTTTTKTSPPNPSVTKTEATTKTKAPSPRKPLSTPKTTAKVPPMKKTSPQTKQTTPPSKQTTPPSKQTTPPAKPPSQTTKTPTPRTSSTNIQKRSPLSQYNKPVINKPKSSSTSQLPSRGSAPILSNTKFTQLEKGKRSSVPVSKVTARKSSPSPSPSKLPIPDQPKPLTKQGTFTKVTATTTKESLPDPNKETTDVKLREKDPINDVENKRTSRTSSRSSKRYSAELNEIERAKDIYDYPPKPVLVSNHSPQDNKSSTPSPNIKNIKNKSTSNLIKNSSLSDVRKSGSTTSLKSAGSRSTTPTGRSTTAKVSPSGTPPKKFDTTSKNNVINATYKANSPTVKRKSFPVTPPKPLTNSPPKINNSPTAVANKQPGVIGKKQVSSKIAGFWRKDDKTKAEKAEQKAEQKAEKAALKAENKSQGKSVVKSAKSLFTKPVIPNKLKKNPNKKFGEGKVVKSFTYEKICDTKSLPRTDNVDRASATAEALMNASRLSKSGSILDTMDTTTVFDDSELRYIDESDMSMINHNMSMPVFNDNDISRVRGNNDPNMSMPVINTRTWTKNKQDIILNNLPDADMTMIYPDEDEPTEKQEKQPSIWVKQKTEKTPKQKPEKKSFRNSFSFGRFGKKKEPISQKPPTSSSMGVSTGCSANFPVPEQTEQTEPQTNPQTDSQTPPMTLTQSELFINEELDCNVSALVNINHDVTSPTKNPVVDAKMVKVADSPSKQLTKTEMLQARRRQSGMSGDDDEMKSKCLVTTV